MRIWSRSIKFFGLLAIVLAPDFSGASELDLSAYRGKVVYIDFWASWCGPCRQSFPWLSNLQDHYGSENIVVLGINVDQERRKADRFLDQTPARFPIMYDPAGRLATEYKVSSMPSSFLIDRSGRIRYRHHGFSPKEINEYERQIAELLHEGPSHEAN